MLSVPRRRVLASLRGPNCAERIKLDDEQTLRVNSMSCCCPVKIEPCIVQGADKTFSFVAPEGTDFSLAAEIEFRVWENVDGAELLAFSETGGGITIISDNSFALTVTNAQSAGITKGSKWCAAWAEMAGGERYALGSGPFKVNDIGDITS